jgi:hypothetical protein
MKNANHQRVLALTATLTLAACQGERPPAAQQALEDPGEPGALVTTSFEGDEAPENDPSQRHNGRASVGALFVAGPPWVMVSCFVSHQTTLVSFVRTKAIASDGKIYTRPGHHPAEPSFGLTAGDFVPAGLQQDGQLTGNELGDLLTAVRAVPPVLNDPSALTHTSGTQPLNTLVAVQQGTVTAAPEPGRRGLIDSYQGGGVGFSRSTRNDPHVDAILKHSCIVIDAQPVR